MRKDILQLEKNGTKLTELDTDVIPTTIEKSGLVVVNIMAVVEFFVEDYRFLKSSANILSRTHNTIFC